MNDANILKLLKNGMFDDPVLVTGPAGNFPGKFRGFMILDENATLSWDPYEDSGGDGKWSASSEVFPGDKVPYPLSGQNMTVESGSRVVVNRI